MSELSELLQELSKLLSAAVPPPKRPSNRRFPAEFPVGTILSFYKKYPASPKEYHYAAIRVPNGQWYVSGTRPQPAMNWSELCTFIGTGRCSIATSWVDLP